MPTSVYELVIIADDFGLSGSVSKAIVELLRSGIVSATSAMMCEPLTKELLLLNKQYLSGRCGVHLQATKSRPLLAHNQVVSLTDSKGDFSEKWNSNLYMLSELKAEWLAQIEEFLMQGVGLTHIDSHHNVHLSDEVLRKFTNQLGNLYEARVRQTANQLIREKSHAADCDICLNSWTLSGKPVSDLVHEIEQLVESNSNLQRIEIISHPGFVDERLKDVSSATYSREFEFDELMKLPWLLDVNRFVIKNYRSKR